MKIRTIVSVLTLSFFLSTCGVFFSDYKGEGTITVSVGDGTGGVSRAIDTTQPPFPEFSEIYIRISKGGIIFAEETFKATERQTDQAGQAGPASLSADSYNFKVPAGSGYKVEVRATPIIPIGFAKEYGGVANNVNTGGGNVYIPLAISSSLIFYYSGYGNGSVSDAFFCVEQENSWQRQVGYQSPSKHHFFDQYGYLYYVKDDGGNDKLFQIITPVDSWIGVAGVENDGPLMPYNWSTGWMAHAPGSRYFYYYDLYKDYGTYIIRGDLASPNANYMEVTGAPEYSVGGDKFAVTADGTFFILSGKEGDARLFISKGSVSETETNVRYNHSSINRINGVGSEIGDFKLFNEHLFILESRPKDDGSGGYIYDFYLHSLDYNLNVKFSKIIAEDFPRTDINFIAGTNKNSIYIAIGESATTQTEIYELDMTTGEKKNKKPVL